MPEHAVFGIRCFLFGNCRAGMIERPAAANWLASRIMSMATKEEMTAGTGRGWVAVGPGMVFDIVMKITYDRCESAMGAQDLPERVCHNAPRGSLGTLS